MVGAKGFEPCGPDSQVIYNQHNYGKEGVTLSQIDSQKLDANSPGLARIVDSWQNLPDHVRQAINALMADCGE